MKELEFAQGIEKLGGQLYIVGGWVRDKIRGVKPKDKDYMILGVKEDDLIKAYPQLIKVGKAFPVFNLKVDGENCEIALARKDVKIGPGYRGFKIIFNPHITLEEDLYRRDTKMNALAYNVLTKEIIDPFQGIADIKAKRITAISHHFKEDPVRTLRVARQACEFGFTIDKETIKLMMETVGELKQEPGERLVAELQKVLATDQPSRFFRILQEIDILREIFPEIYALIGQSQPEAYHPEGDAFEHTMEILDLVASYTNDVMTRFAALVHDLGKGVTPKEMLPHHYGHEVVGSTVLAQWATKMNLPKHWLKAGDFVITTHMKAARLGKPGKIVDLLLAIDKSALNMENYKAIILADNKTLPSYLEKGAELIEIIKKVDMEKCPPHLQGPEIGKWVKEQRIRNYLRTIKEKS